MLQQEAANLEVIAGAGGSVRRAQEHIEGHEDHNGGQEGEEEVRPVKFASKFSKSLSAKFNFDLFKHLIFSSYSNIKSSPLVIDLKLCYLY